MPRLTARGAATAAKAPAAAAAAAVAAVALAVLGAGPAVAATQAQNQVPGSASGSAGGSGADAETVIGGALLVFAIAGLGLVLRGRRAGGGRRKPAHAGAPGHGDDGGADHPNWPANTAGWAVSGATTGYRQTPGPDSPDWPYPDHPSWPANAAGRPLTPDHPSWPAGDIGGPIPGDDPGWPGASPSGGRAGPGGLPARPGLPPPGGQPGLPRRERPGAAPAPPVHHDLPSRRPVPHVPRARGRHVVLIGAPRENHRWAAGPSSASVLQPPHADAGRQAAVGWQPADPGNADAIRLARRILADADQQAAEIRREADAQAAAIRGAAERDAVLMREQTAAEAAPIREAAEREAAEITARAADEAAAIRETAEREVDALRSAVKTMSANLNQMAAYITERFAGPGERITVTTAPAPVRAPGEAPSSHKEVGAVEQAAPGPGATGRAMPTTAPARPATRPARRTKTPARPRQYRTLRVCACAIAALVVLALGTGAYQLATRGFTFFAFRSAGTGATDNNAIFPGIIPTPKPSPAHHRPTNAAGHHDSRKVHHRHHHSRRTHHHV